MNFRPQRRDVRQDKFDWESVKAIEQALWETGLADSDQDYDHQEEGTDSLMRQKRTKKQLDGIDSKLASSPNSSTMYFSNSLRYTRHCAEEYRMKSSTQSFGSDSSAPSSPQRQAKKACTCKHLKRGQSPTFGCNDADIPCIRERSFSCNIDLSYPRTELGGVQNASPPTRGALLRRAAERARQHKLANIKSDRSPALHYERGRSGSYGGGLSCSDTELIRLHLKHHQEHRKRLSEQEVGVGEVHNRAQTTFSALSPAHSTGCCVELPEIDIHVNIISRGNENTVWNCNSGATAMTKRKVVKTKTL